MPMAGVGRGRRLQAFPRRHARGGQGRIGGPTGRRRPALHEKADQDQRECRPHEPVRQHVQLRKRHVLGADHERDGEVAEGPHQHGDDHEEDHDAGVHAEEHVVKGLGHAAAVGFQKPVTDDGQLGVRPAQLCPHQHGQGPADDQEDQRGKQELNADDLVIGRKNIFADKAHLGMGMGFGGMRLAGTHVFLIRCLRFAPCFGVLECGVRRRFGWGPKSKAATNAALQISTPLANLMASNHLLVIVCSSSVFFSQAKKSCLVSWT